MEKKKIPVDGRFFVSERAHVILPYHKLIDGMLESDTTQIKIGTTKKGIGPCYTDKVRRVGIRVIDYIDKEVFLELYDQVCSQAEAVTISGRLPPGIPENAYEELRTYLDDIESRLSGDKVSQMTNIERRIANMFDGRLSEEQQVVDLNMVADAKTMIGSPSSQYNRVPEADV